MANKAFTLVELAIVIVIIGLLVGGVLAGQELVRQAEIRRFIVDMYGIESAVMQYNDKYKAYPGDDIQALTRFPTCTDLGPCLNGDSNKQISASETPFTHLLASRFIKGGLCPSIPGVGNILVSPIKSACWGMWKPTAAIALFGQMDFTWLFVISQTSGGVFSPEDTMTIDEKVDDGNASLGRMLGIGSGGSCTTPSAYDTTPAGGGVYNIATNQKFCRPYYRLNL